MKFLRYIKPKTAIAALIILILGVCLALYKICPQGEPVFTTIGIFADYQHPEADDGRAIIYEVLKTIDGSCDHIFINKKLFKELYQFVFPELFNESWHVYDTRIGLLYVQRIKGDHKVGINVDQWTRIENPFDEQALNNVQDGAWATQCSTLIDVKKWRAHHAHPESKIMIYCNGHGTADADNYALEMIVSASATKYAQLLKFIHDELRVHLVGIQSCHWTADRITRLMRKECGIDALSFTLLTPASIERPIWIETHINYLNNDAPSFFEVCCDTAYMFNGTITDKIAETIKNTDTLQLTGNRNQHASLVMAGTCDVKIV